MGNSLLAKIIRQGCLGMMARVATIWAFAAKPQGGKYELSHLVQQESQSVGGPVQDDEALLLFAVARGMRMRAVLEVGGLSGFSALNFCRALAPEAKGFVVTIDINPVRKVADNHETVQKEAGKVGAEDIKPLFGKYSLPPRFDIIFFDAHVYEEQMRLLHNLRQAELADDETIIALHDTCPHPMATHLDAKPVPLPKGGEGYINCPQEVRMIDDLLKEGYHAFHLHPRREYLGGAFPFRHGITLMQLPQQKPDR